MVQNLHKRKYTRTTAVRKCQTEGKQKESFCKQKFNVVFLFTQHHVLTTLRMNSIALALFFISGTLAYDICPQFSDVGAQEMETRTGGEGFYYIFLEVMLCSPVPELLNYNGISRHPHNGGEPQ